MDLRPNSLPRITTYKWEVIRDANLHVIDSIPIIEQRKQEHLEGEEPWGKQIKRRIICACVGKARYTPNKCDVDEEGGASRLVPQQDLIQSGE